MYSRLSDMGIRTVGSSVTVERVSAKSLPVEAEPPLIDALVGLSLPLPVTSLHAEICSGSGRA